MTSFPCIAWGEETAPLISEVCGTNHSYYTYMPRTHWYLIINTSTPQQQITILLYIGQGGEETEQPTSEVCVTSLTYICAYTHTRNPMVADHKDFSNTQPTTNDFLSLHCSGWRRNSPAYLRGLYY